MIFKHIQRKAARSAQDSTTPDLGVLPTAVRGADALDALDLEFVPFQSDHPHLGQALLLADAENFIESGAIDEGGPAGGEGGGVWEICERDFFGAAEDAAECDGVCGDGWGRATESAGD